MDLKIDDTNKLVELYVVSNNLPYVLVGLPHCEMYKFNTDCNKIEITQNK